MNDKLDLENLQKNKKSVKIGELSQEVIDILNLDMKPRNIYMWPDRLMHCEKHKDDFASEAEYYKSMESIPSIIKNPDFVGIHPNNKGIFYIKKIDSNCLVGITMDSLLFRSMYPIKESKLDSYIKQGRIYPFK